MTHKCERKRKQGSKRKSNKVFKTTERNNKSIGRIRDTDGKQKETLRGKAEPEL